MRRWFVIVCAAAVALPGRARVAHAQSCARPTDAGGARGFSYGAATPKSFGNERVLVWYVTTGPHAARPASAHRDGVPDDVADVAQITAEALESFAAMGYRAPIADAINTACGSNGGDGRLDVYLVAMVGADGLTVVEPDRCEADGDAFRCAGYILAQADFTGLYPTIGIGIRTVLPHEAFHAVHNAYDAGLDRFWAEGTAQWAAASLDPSLTDLERFLPAFFTQTSRSLDASPNGVTSAFLYGTAVWPLFLSRHYGDDVVRAILEAESDGTAALAATDAVLRGRHASLASAFQIFSVWNAAAGMTAVDGYPHGARYPKVTAMPLPATGTVQGITSGLAAFFYRGVFPAGVVVSLATDAARNAGTIVPVVDGVVRIDWTTALPPGDHVPVTGEAIVVVSGITTNKTDAPFSLTVDTPDGGALTGSDAGAADGSTQVDGGSEEGEGPGGGCTCETGGPPNGGALAFCLVISFAVRRTRKERSQWVSL